LIQRQNDFYLLSETDKSISLAAELLPDKRQIIEPLVEWLAGRRQAADKGTSAQVAVIEYIRRLSQI
jgi:hypothetical protein